jgi:hypothetical protein
VILNPGDASAPQGNGYVTFAVSSLGVVTSAGTLADGTKFTHSSQIGQSGKYPFYVTLYSQAGFLMGEINFRELAGVSDADGALTWSTSASSRSAVALKAARFQAKTPMLAGMANSGGTMRLSVSTDEAGDLVVQSPFGLSADNTKFVALSTNPKKVVLALTVSTGLFSGTLTHGGVKIPIRGVLYQKGAGHGVGWIRSSTKSGQVVLIPAP